MYNKDKERSVEPILKWPGGKRRLAGKIHELLPDGKRLVEPFVGSGAVSLAKEDRYESFWWNDASWHLMTAYEEMRNDFARFFIELNKLTTNGDITEARYKMIRDRFNENTNNNVAACLIFLNKTCFNGIYRTNKEGKFNVPWNKVRKPFFPELQNICDLREFLQRVELTLLDFSDVMAQCVRGDVVYCDPPYASLDDYGGWNGYSTVFGDDQQKLLAKAAEECAARGVPVVISNHDTQFTRKIYSRATAIHDLQVRRSVSCKNSGRRTVSEILVVYA